MGTALQSLVVSASLLGIDPRPALPPPAAPKAALPRGPLTELERIPLAEVVKGQQGAWVYSQAGRVNLGFRAAFDAKGDAWIILRDGDRRSTHALTEFTAGVEEEFSGGRTRIVVENFVLRAFPVAAPQTPQAQVPVNALLRALFDNAKHVRFPAVDYALAYEDAGPAGPSVSLIRRDADGNFFVSYHSLAELSEISWLVGVDNTLYGMKREGQALVFYSEPSPVIKKH